MASTRDLTPPAELPRFLPPSVVIECELEGTQVWFYCDSEAEAERLEDWINSRPELCDLVSLALELTADPA